MGVKVDIKSLNPRGFQNYTKSLQKQIKDKMNVAGNLVRNTAVQSILGGSKSGKVYEKYNPRRTHRSSGEGQSPASDTGFLASNIVLNLEATGMVAEVESRAKYSIFLEFGTQNMKARPFMQPALEENKPKIRRMFATIKGKAK
jgi:HK97 gp10 family phage protein